MKQKYVKRRITWVDILLLVIFIGLLILVCYLGYKTFTVSKQNVETVDIIIPLIKKGEPQEFSVDLSLLEPDDKMTYYFKITNYRENRVNKNSIKYKVMFTLPKDIDIKLYDVKSEKELLNGGLNTSDFVLQGGKKQDNLYKLIVKSKKKMSKDDSISIRIES